MLFDEIKNKIKGILSVKIPTENSYFMDTLSVFFLLHEKNIFFDKKSNKKIFQRALFLFPNSINVVKDENILH